MPRPDSTDRTKRQNKKKRRWLLLPLALVALPITMKLLGVQSTNRAATSPSHEDASLRTRFYTGSAPDVAVQVLVAAPALSTYGQAWRIKSQAIGEAGPCEVRCEVPVLVFVDDLTITIAPDKSGSRVDVASASRVGQGDFGENARHIRQILGALDKRCAPSKS